MPPNAAAASPGQLTWGVHVSLAPAWFDPADASGIITPFMVFYALHDGMVKPMPGKALAPSLAESIAASEDGQTYDFVIRDGATFHNGAPVTSADVKFSFDRYLEPDSGVSWQYSAGTQVKVVDDYTVQVISGSPSVWFTQALVLWGTDIMSQKYVSGLSKDDIAAKPLDDLRTAGQRPIDASGEKFGDRRFQPERSPRKKPA